MHSNCNNNNRYRNITTAHHRLFPASTIGHRFLLCLLPAPTITTRSQPTSASCHQTPLILYGFIVTLTLLIFRINPLNQLFMVLHVASVYYYQKENHFVLFCFACVHIQYIAYDFYTHLYAHVCMPVFVHVHFFGFCLCVVQNIPLSSSPCALQDSCLQ